MTSMLAKLFMREWINRTSLEAQAGEVPKDFRVRHFLPLFF
jgi:hypothetical protein